MLYIRERMGRQSKGRAALWVKDTDTIPEVINTLVPIASSLKFRKLILMVDEILYRRYLMRYPHKIISKEVVLAQKLK